MMATGAGKSLCFYLVPLATSPNAVGASLKLLQLMTWLSFPKKSYFHKEKMKSTEYINFALIHLPTELSDGSAGTVINSWPNY